MRAENPRKRERTRMSVRKDRAIATQRPILCVKGAQGDATWARHLAIARGDARHARGRGGTMHFGSQSTAMAPKTGRGTRRSAPGRASAPATAPRSPLAGAASEPQGGPSPRRRASVGRRGARQRTRVGMRTATAPSKAPGAPPPRGCIRAPRLGKHVHMKSPTPGVPGAEHAEVRGRPGRLAPCRL